MNPYYNFDTPLTPGTKARASEVNAQLAAIAAGFDSIPAVGEAPFGTPTVKVGLTFAQGSADFVLRSDAQLALDETIAPTWTAQHTFGLKPLVSQGSPGIFFNETDGAANNRLWDFNVQGEQLQGRVLNDLISTSANWLTVDRTANTVDSIELNGTVIVLNGRPRINSAAVELRGTTTDPATNVIYASYQTSNGTERAWTGFDGIGGEFRVQNNVSGAPLNLVTNGGNVQVNGSSVWHVGNDGAGSGLDADLLDGVQGASFLQTANLLASILAIDGAGSGLDADLLDGVQGSDYARLSQANTFTAPLKVSAAGDGSAGIALRDTGAGTDVKEFKWDSYQGVCRLITVSDAGSQLSAPVTFTRNADGTLSSAAITATALTWNGNTIFTTANDGASSGLDADLLDGVQGADYARISAANTFAGAQTISATTPTLIFTETDGPSNEKNWEWLATGGSLLLTVLDDALSNDQTVISIQRSGTTVSSIEFTATQMLLNGVPIEPSDATDGTFTGTLTGFGSNPTGTVNYAIVNGLCTLWVDADITATSNATSLGMTGLPAAVRPSVDRAVACYRVCDGGVSLHSAAALVDSSGVIDFAVVRVAAAPGGASASTGSFTASGTKGLHSGWCITYPL